MTNQQELILKGLRAMMERNPSDSFFRHVTRISAALAVKDATNTDVVNAMIRLGVIDKQHQNGNQ